MPYQYKPFRPAIADSLQQLMTRSRAVQPTQNQQAMPQNWTDQVLPQAIAGMINQKSQEAATQRQLEKEIEVYQLKNKLEREQQFSEQEELQKRFDNYSAMRNQYIEKTGSEPSKEQDFALGMKAGLSPKTLIDYSNAMKDKDKEPKLNTPWTFEDRGIKKTVYPTFDENGNVKMIPLGESRKEEKTMNPLQARKELFGVKKTIAQMEKGNVNDAMLRGFAGMVGMEIPQTEQVSEDSKKELLDAAKQYEQDLLDIISGKSNTVKTKNDSSEYDSTRSAETQLKGKPAGYYSIDGRKAKWNGQTLIWED